jgi:uncharacterized membrane protein YoaK (UPF0700 family)
MDDRGPAGGGSSGPDTGSGGGYDRRLAVLLYLLSLGAGCADALSYLVLGQVFTANMTGNTVLLGLALGSRDPGAGASPGLSLLGFAGGVAAGALLGRWRSAAPGASGTRRGGSDRGGVPRESQPRFTRAVMLELVMLLVYAAGLVGSRWAPGKGAELALVTVASFGMGAQGAAVASLGVPGVQTTVVTGTITSLVESIVRGTGGAWLRSVHSGVVVAYGGGAVVGAVALRFLPVVASFLPACAIAGVVAMALRRAPGPPRGLVTRG